MALASSVALGFPAILRAQSEAIRVGHLTPAHGISRPDRRVRLSRRGAGGGRSECGGRRTRQKDRTDRRGQRQSRHGGEQGAETLRARPGDRLGRGDQLGIGGGDRAGRGANEAHSFQYRRQLRRSARQELQSLSVSRRRQQHHVRSHHRTMVEGSEPHRRQAVSFPGRRLCIRSRPLSRLLAVP